MIVAPYVNQCAVHYLTKNPPHYYLNDFYQTDDDIEPIDTINSSYSNSYIIALNQFLISLNILINSK
jgi:hypothetical protein